jgi:HAD superfamily hydrolase (TIGR01450 family)
VPDADPRRERAPVAEPSIGVPVERDDDRQFGRPPRSQSRQEPRDAPGVTTPAHGVQEVVAIDDDELDQVEVGVRPGPVGAGRARGYHQPVLLIVDLDGVVYRGLTPVPGVPEVLSRRAAGGDIIAYATNNSRWHRSDYEARLVSMGAPVQPDRIVTAARATALALASRPDPLDHVMVFGGPGLGRELRDAGLRTVAPTDRGLAAGPGAVVVGIDFSLSHDRLSIAADAIRDGALFVATNRDAVYPIDGRLMAGAGAIVAALVTASGREPDLVIGKPEPGLFRQAAQAAGETPDRAIVIGDGLRTDILAANRVGARSVLMLTGVTTRAQLDASDPDERPTAVAADAAELERVLEAFALDDRGVDA